MTRNTRAIGWMVLSMACFALSDAMIRIASEHIPVLQSVLAVTGGCLVLFWAMAYRAGVPIFSPNFFHPGVLMRNGAEALGMIAFSTALTMTAFVQVVAIGQAVPVIVTLGAVFILGETVGLRRWFAVFLGLAGVLVMLRPEGQLDAGSLMALLGTFGLAMRDVFTRLAPPQVSVLQLATWAMAAVTAACIALLSLRGGATGFPPQTLPILGFGILAHALAYIAITQSVRMAPVSHVIPFRYSRLLFGTAIGVALFGETLEVRTIVGSLIVVAAGLYILHRERHTPPLLNRDKGG